MTVKVNQSIYPQYCK